MLKQERASKVLDSKADQPILNGDDLRAGAQKMQAAKFGAKHELLCCANELAKSAIPEVRTYALAFRAALEGNAPKNFMELKHSAIAAARTA